MDAHRFDAITKVWISLPRRRLLGGLATGALAPMLGLGGQEASAQSCRRSRQCGKGEACVHRLCVPKCGDPFTCSSGEGRGCPGTCLCTNKPGGGGVCVTGGNICDGLQVCTRQRQCPPGQICTTGCCGPDDPKFVCLPACIE